MFSSCKKKIIIPKKKNACGKDKIVLSLYQENVFLSSETISVSEEIFRSEQKQFPYGFISY